MQRQERVEREEQLTRRKNLDREKDRDVYVHRENRYGEGRIVSSLVDRDISGLFLLDCT